MKSSRADKRVNPESRRAISEIYFVSFIRDTGNVDFDPQIDALDSYSGDYKFESGFGYVLFLLRHAVGLLSPSAGNDGRLPRLGHDHFLPDTLRVVTQLLPHYSTFSSYQHGRKITCRKCL
jgi:hypothetical protein